MHEAIGTAAGVVWRVLNLHGEMTVTQLKQEVQLSGSMVERAIGWLAREGKIEELQQGRTTRLRLRTER